MKLANLIVRDDDVVKVLDFGFVKAMDAGDAPHPARSRRARRSPEPQGSYKSISSTTRQSSS